jgi:beta-galactosidase
MIVVPPLPVVPADFADRLAASGAQVVLGPRTGSKTANLTIPAALPPGEGIAKLIPFACGALNRCGRT